MDTRPVVVTVPTELSRSDPFADLSVLFLAIGGTWYAANMHIVWFAVPVLICAAIWTLTGEPAGDVRFIGAVASTLRSRLGLRRAHEWALAWAHYLTVKTWPDFKRWANARLQRMHVALSRVRWIGWLLERTVPVLQGSYARLRLPLWVSRRLRARAAQVPTL